MTVVKEMIKERVRRAQVHDYVQKKTTRAGFGGLSIQRTPLGTHVRIAAERPGLVIGRKGSDIQKLTEELERKFGYENLQVEAGEVNNFALNPLHFYYICFEACLSIHIFFLLLLLLLSLY